MNNTEQLYKFLRDLAQNNNRPWFQQHKEQFDEIRANWLAELDRLIAAMTLWEPGMATQTGRTAAYRIYRDTRFSSDKTPYKTFFSAVFNPEGRKSTHAGYYLEMSPFESRHPGLYGGLWCVERPMLTKLRHAIVDNIEEWEEIVNAPELVKNFPGWFSDMLKTIPKGWDRNHPQAFYLRMTNYGKYHPCDEKFFLRSDWPEQAAEQFHILQPMIQFLNYSMDEDL
ncbi:MAG: DUF2461 domain-containing protein [Firmicutes bacterium]|nr:DUF2461 domain-containing protein [Bacillota bacterium]MCM1400407.1 DUF2461 domain-containing protein [Bacteroides sp.]MCM1477164.1 DUF2461 domain-containing protein [Bacteroides sp.]